METGETEKMFKQIEKLFFIKLLALILTFGENCCLLTENKKLDLRGFCYYEQMKDLPGFQTTLHIENHVV